jgi:serine/threonine protein kinase
VIAGRYVLEREVGRGGMGAVWLARDETLGRRVALKRIGTPQGDVGRQAARAEREARLAAGLAHPHVVSVFDLVPDGEQRWLVMEYVEGRSLAARVRDRGPLPPAQAADLLRQASEALREAHAAGIVHRDVKPSNMLVTPDDELKLTDFGIAKSADDVTLTEAGLVTGSPAYLAPEVAAGDSATTASDVWSIGATLYHLLSGSPPYEVADNLMGTLYRIVHEPPPRLANTGWLGPLLEATMASDPAHRWTMGQVADYLAAGQEGTTGEPVGTVAPVPVLRDGEGTHVMGSVAASSPPPPPPPVARRVERDRRPTVSTLVGALLVVSVLVLAVVVFLLVRDSGSGTTASAGSDGAAGSPSATATPSPSPSTSTSPASPSSSPSLDPQQQRAAMEAFVVDYLSTVTSDPSRTWPRLTPDFQEASGGFDSYASFWGTIAGAVPSRLSADPDAGTVAYTVEYTRQDGSTTTDDVTLRLVERGGEYLIAGES